MARDRTEKEGSLGKSSFEFKNIKDSERNTKVLMCDHELNGEIDIGYFVIGKPTTPKDQTNLENEKLEEGQTMVYVPPECVERMLCHYEAIMRRKAMLQQKKVTDGGPNLYRPKFRPQRP